MSLKALLLKFNSLLLEIKLVYSLLSLDVSQATGTVDHLFRIFLQLWCSPL